MFPSDTPVVLGDERGPDRTPALRSNQTQHNCPAMKRRLPIVREPSLTAGLVVRIREARTEEVAIPALWNRVSMQEVDALASDPFVVLKGGRLTTWPASLPAHFFVVVAAWACLSETFLPLPTVASALLAQVGK